MSFRRALITLTVFFAVATVLSSMVFVTLRREVSGSTRSYTALFTDASGLRVGDDVRVAGVRVGRVDAVELAGTLAKVTIRVQQDHKLYTDTRASITYQNIIGQRYVGLSPGASSAPRQLADGGQIPVENTEPSFDISALVNGFQPLFTTLDPRKVTKLSDALVQALQGDNGALTTLIAETASLAQTLAGDDDTLGALIDNLNSATEVLGRQSGNLHSVISQARDLVTGLARRRDTLMPSLNRVAAVGGELSLLLGDTRPTLDDMFARDPGMLRYLIDNRVRFAFLGENAPQMLKGLARTSQEGSYINAYVCNLNVTIFASLSWMIPKIVDLATPGGVSKNTPICR